MKQLLLALLLMLPAASMAGHEIFNLGERDAILANAANQTARTVLGAVLDGEWVKSSQEIC